MSEDALTDREREQLRVLYSVHLNPTITATWRHDDVRSLIGKGYAIEHPEYGFPMAALTDKGIEAAKAM